MLTTREEISLHRLRDHDRACQICAIAAGIVALGSILAPLAGAPRSLVYVGAFEGFVALVALACHRRNLRQIRALEAMRG